MAGKLFAIATVILLLLVSFFLFRGPRERKRIPNIIWTYWDSDQLPPFIQQCISTWYEHNPDFEIHVLNRTNLNEFLSEQEIHEIETWKYNDSPQRFSDLVRLTVLPKYGGVWLDASIVCYESFSWIHDENSECIVYSIPELAPPEVPMLESWFIACTKGNEFVTAWRDEFVGVKHFRSINEYVLRCKTDLVGIQYPDYLLVYVCARKVYLSGHRSNVRILNATTGPYSYHVHGGVESVCNIPRPKFYKFRKEDRAKMSETGEYRCLFLRA